MPDYSLENDALFNECPPCKIIICSAGVAGGAQRVASMAQAAAQLARQKPKSDAKDLVTALWYAEKAMKECGDKLEAAINAHALQ